MKRMYFDIHKSCCSCCLFSFLLACACFFTFVSCDEASCNEPLVISNAQPDLLNLSTPFPNGTNITYNCVDGFALPPGANLHVVCVAANETSYSWIHDDENIKCAQVCGDVPRIVNATVEKNVDPPYRIGVRFKIACERGYISGGASPTIVCVSSEGNANWEYPERPCRPRSCGHPGDIENSQLLGNVFTFPNSVTYQCNEGFKIKGRATIYCMGSGTWGDSRPTCEAIICPLLPELDNGRVNSRERSFGKVAIYECDRGFKLNGPHERICGPDSQWTDRPPTCDVITCIPPGELPNGRVINTKDVYNVNDFVIFECNMGGTSRTSKCLEDGNWSLRPPSCPGPTVVEPPSSAGPPTVPPSTQSPTSSTEKPNDSTVEAAITTVGAVTPNTVTVKNLSGSTGGTTITTIDVTPNTVIVKNASGTTRTTLPEYDNYDSVASMTENSLEKINVKTTIHLTPSAAAPTSNVAIENFNASMCEDPGDIPHGNRTVSGLVPGGNVTYICEDGYDLRGKGTLICLGTGKWDLDKLPICMKPAFIALLVTIFMWRAEFVF